MLAATLLALAGLVPLSKAGYAVEDAYDAATFFTLFDFFTDEDPTGGFVDYVDQATAESNGLVSINGSSIRIGVDSTNVASSAGRQSVRLTSTTDYNHGLVVLDLAHMPGGICGTWPAFWMVGPNWPNEGEIDIIEGVNSQSGNDMTLHTDDGCSISNTGDFSGTLGTSNCYVDAAGQSTNAGCQITTDDTATYGTAFNSNGGGVYAAEWTSDAIAIWFFARGSIPSDITDGSPDPTSWSEPLAKFSGSCDIDEHFQDMNLVFDTTFCGDWAGEVWSTDSTCSALASSCQDYVQNNPSAFADAYWEINSLNVYSVSSNATIPTTNTSSTTSSIAANATSSLVSASVATAAGASSTANFTANNIIQTPVASSSITSAAAAASITTTLTTSEEGVYDATVTQVVTAMVTVTQGGSSAAETLSALNDNEFEGAEDGTQSAGIPSAAATLRRSKRSQHQHAREHAKRNIMIGDEKRMAMW